MNTISSGHASDLKADRGPSALGNIGDLPFSFDQLVRSLSDVLGPSSGIDSEDVDPRDLIDLMSRYTSDEKEWSQYALSDSNRNYTRNLVDSGNGKSNLLIVVWNPGKSSPIHDHADAHCVMKILQGSLQEKLYEPVQLETNDQGNDADDDDDDDESEHSDYTSHSSSNSDLGLDENNVSGRRKGRVTYPPRLTKQTTYSSNEVTYISDKIGLHKITNPSPTQPAVSLHLYTPPHAATSGFNLFDERTGRKSHVPGSVCFSVKGERVGE